MAVAPHTRMPRDSEVRRVDVEAVAPLTLSAQRGWIGERPQRRLEDACHFAGVEPQCGSGAAHAGDRMEQEAADRNLNRRHRAEYLDRLGSDAAFFERFPQRGFLNRLSRLDRAARQRYLSTVLG